jgi:hypothetical protein
MSECAKFRCWQRWRRTKGRGSRNFPNPHVVWFAPPLSTSEFRTDFLQCSFGWTHLVPVVIDTYSQSLFNFCLFQNPFSQYFYRHAAQVAGLGDTNFYLKGMTSCLPASLVCLLQSLPASWDVCLSCRYTVARYIFPLLPLSIGLPSSLSYLLGHHGYISTMKL